MVYHIYIYTPLNELSDYFPHLIEHCVLGGIRNGAEYFHALKFRAESYTYYTCFTIKADSIDEIESFCAHIRKNISDEVIRFESKVMRQEIENSGYFQLLISKIGKHLYGKKFQYSSPAKFNRVDLKSYHKKYYTDGKLIVLERDLVQKDIVLSGFEYSYSFDIQHNNKKELVFVGEFSPEGLFMNEILQNLLDSYIEFQTRYIKGEYFSSETLAGEFENDIFLGISRRDHSLLSTIPSDFIQEFTKYSLLNFSNTNYRDIDGPMMIKYGYSISEKSKKEMIGGISQYYQQFKEKLIS